MPQKLRVITPSFMKMAPLRESIYSHRSIAWHRFSSQTPQLSESQGHRLHREGTGTELLQEGRSLLVRLRRDGTAIYLSPRVTSATVAKYLQPSPNISKHRQRDSDLAIPDNLVVVKKIKKSYSSIDFKTVYLFNQAASKLAINQVVLVLIAFILQVSNFYFF